jgi:2-isopropylmalate synthase
MSSLSEEKLIYDWNRKGEPLPPRASPIEFDDETLRDGLQSPSIKDPKLDEKIRILHLMEGLGIQACDIGLPGSGARAYETCLSLAREVGENRMKIRPNCAVRTVRADVDPLIDISMKVGFPLEAAMFIGSSPIRFYAEGWTLEKVHRMTEDAVGYAVQNGIPVMYVTEDTTRTNPESIRDLFRTAIFAGARRVCVADTVGHAIPPGVSALLRFVRGVVEETGEEVKIDWHGHSDRGLAVTNAMRAFDEGVDRIHGTALGIGERCGNMQMDQLLVNLKLDGQIENDLSLLDEYCKQVSRATGYRIPVNYPVFGRDAFRTSTGVHAAAIIKAMEHGARWFVDAVYSGVPAHMVGRDQEIEIGFMSGASNVSYYLRSRGQEPTPELVERILKAAKQKHTVLSEDEVAALIAEHGSGGGSLRR